MSSVLDNLQYLHGAPESRGVLKAQPEHFQVNEVLGFDFAGQGEHFLVHIRKRGENTKYVVNELAKACGVKSRDVSWAGLKDRHAVTEQWISVHLPGKPDPDLTEFVETHPGVEVVATARHDKKLRPGDLQGNRFVITVSDFEASADIETRLGAIREHGVPNYFGAQRFGREGNNITSARNWGRGEFKVRDKSKRSFYLSAARSYLFNMVASARLEQGKFAQAMLGDCLQYGNSENCVVAETEQHLADVANGAAVITGPMTGDNALPTKGDAQAFEQSIIDVEPDLLAVIRDNRMRHDRRALRLLPTDMEWSLAENALTVTFTLPAGAFATAVMRELIQAGELDE
uniref:tRNA pseudouridine(13) synthase TruD n=1 Tax=Thaumasiovibrio occultus TaxID=1891184 RepID=UPI000B3502C2|nr:tRNA pseudouridine(13) synthase TruD [Thaumasiovibrio occultus]